MSDILDMNKMKPRLVMKFGGTSVSDYGRMEVVADKVMLELSCGYDVVVVVSAMGVETDRLIGMIDRIGLVDARECDSLLSTGEQVSSALLTLILSSRDIPCRSWLGWQIPIYTDGKHGSARIADIETKGIEESFSREGGMVAVCAGFQGISPRGRITTLGRGGSDTTAVALAVALGAERCDIYTDVLGFYSADPRLVPKARKIKTMSYEESLELASAGAKVLHVRSVEMAMRYGMSVRVLSSFEKGDGTLVSGDNSRSGVEMEEKVVTGLALSKNECQVTVVGVSDVPGTVASIFEPLVDAQIDVDMIIQSASPDKGKTNITFSIDKRSADITESLLLRSEKIDCESISLDRNVAKVSLVGLGMRSNYGVAQKMFAVLASKGINILAISTSEIKIAVLIEEDYGELAMRTLHTAFELDVE